jgi:4-nitrophenyl phosphatase
MHKPIESLILDMDGVLWHGDTPMPGLAEFFATMRDAGIGCVLATNNATKTAAMYTERLAGFGVAMPPEQILTSAEATASYLTGEYDYGAPAYVIGDRGLREAIAARGFRQVTPREVRGGETAAFVVAGLSRDVTYEDLAMGSVLIRRGAPFIGTNPDVTFPSELGPLPGAGALLALITAATGVEPTIIGKPGPIIFLEAVKRLGSDPATVAMVGDRLSTDITGAKAAGLQAILVLSGISTREEAAVALIKPDYIFEDITELAQFLTRELIADGRA